MTTQHDEQARAMEPIPRLLLTTLQAAKALSISDRTLWALTTPRGPIPCVRIGTAVRYRPADLEAWAAAQAGRGPGAAEANGGGESAQSA